VWGHDNLIADLVMRLPFSATTAEWVVAAVEPTELLRKLEHRGEIRLVEWQALAWGADECRRGESARVSLVLSPCGFRIAIPASGSSGDGGPG
jgi:hypothetical protein